VQQHDRGGDALALVAIAKAGAGLGLTALALDELLQGRGGVLVRRQQTGIRATRAELVVGVVLDALLEFLHLGIAEVVQRMPAEEVAR
jgi:hypothetical protein